MICVINIQVSLPKIRKKSGNYVNYDSNKVFQVILNALDDSEAVQAREFNADTVRLANDITQEVNEEVVGLEQSALDVVTMQNIIYSELIDNDEVIAAREYLHYSDKKMQKKKDDENLLEAVSKVFNKDPKVLNENGNKDSRTLSTQRDLIASQVFRELGLRMYPQDVQEAHKNGLIHLHDLDMSPLLPYTNCCNVNAGSMLKHGFHMGETLMETPNSIGVATAQIALIIESVSLSQYGGTSVPNIDVILSPYAAKNYKKHLLIARKYGINNIKEYAWELTKKDIYNAMQGLEYNINCLHGTGSQVPFVTLSAGLATDKFGTEIQKAMLKVRIKGMSGKSAIFPKLVFTLDKGINMFPEDPNYAVKKLVLKCQSLRDYPDIVFGKNIKSITGGSYMTSMGCRSFLPAWKNNKNEYQISGRLNMGVVTINPVHCALDSESIDAFWKEYKHTVSLAHDALKFRINRIRQVKPQEAPIIWKEGAIARLEDDEDVTPILKNGRCTASLGYIGIYETVAKFYGPNWEHNKEAYQFALDIVNYLHEKCQEWYNEEGYYYSVYSTPSENLTGRFCSIDKEKFGIVKNITDKGYYNNSFHYDVRKPVTPFEKMEFEAPFQHIASGGFISYNEFPDIRNNLDALEAVLDYSYQIGIGYLGTNVPMDKCLSCGFSGKCLETATGYKCPECGETKHLQIVERLCGYLGSLNERQISKGRMNEIEHRVYHTINDNQNNPDGDIHVMPKEK